MKDTEKALRWYCSRIGKRIPELDIHEKHCVSIMYEYAKYYHEQQVKSVDLADVGGNEVDSEEAVCCHPPECVDEYEGWGKEKMLHCNKCGNSW